MTYAEKLRDPRWQRKRLEILNRDSFSCVKCGDKKEQLQVHHKKYIRNIEPWEYDNDILESLCSTCHFIETFYDKPTFLVIKTNWNTTKYTRIVLAYTCSGVDIKTRVLRLNFSRKKIKELSNVPVDLKPLKPIS